MVEDQVINKEKFKQMILTKDLELKPILPGQQILSGEVLIDLEEIYKTYEKKLMVKI